MPEISPIINGGAISRWVESTPSEETLLALNENGQVVASNAVMQAAVPFPTRILSGEIYRTGDRRQMPYLIPPEIEAGGELHIGNESIVYPS